MTGDGEGTRCGGSIYGRRRVSEEGRRRRKREKRTRCVYLVGIMPPVRPVRRPVTTARRD
jgi:hypothetical protein